MVDRRHIFLKFQADRHEIAPNVDAIRHGSVEDGIAQSPSPPSSLNTSLHSSSPDCWMHFIVGPPTCGAKLLARRLAMDTNFTFASLRNLQEDDCEQEKKIGRIRKSLAGGISEDAGFVIVGSPKEVLEFLQKYMKTNAKVRILVLDGDMEVVKGQCLAKDEGKMTLGAEAYKVDSEATEKRLAAYYRSVKVLQQNNRLKKLIRKIPVSVNRDTTYENLRIYVAGC